jgi:nitroimidazol reductase NimA-like FMN-containing flavoprotein (pyridoxamine 5'-phosphate oxidase superfamily)
VRELTPGEIDALLREQVVGRIGCHADGATYVVPVIYAFDGECVHVASIEGRKIRMMRSNPAVCFEVDEYAAPGRWRSAILDGVFEEVSGAEKEATLALLAARFAGGGTGARRPDTQERQSVCFRIRIRAASGRAVERS